MPDTAGARGWSTLSRYTERRSAVRARRMEGPGAFRERSRAERECQSANLDTGCRAYNYGWRAPR